jgi:hypothetical protein
VKVTLSSDYGTVYVWPFCPRVPMTEALEWFTDVITTNRGTDGLGRFRNAPRRAFEVSSVVTWPDSAKAQNGLMNGINERWVMPIWAELTHVGAIASGAGSISVDTANADYGNLALIHQSNSDWEVVEIASVGSGTITLADTVAGDYTEADVMPAQVGRIQQTPAIRTGRVYSTFQFQWQSDENIALEPDAADQYRSDDIYLECPLLDGDGVDDGAVTRVDSLDETTGLVATYAPWTRNRWTRVHRTFRKDATETRELREWLYRRAGQYRPFWMPTYTRDIRITNTGTITNALTIHDDGYGERGHIAIRTTGGTWLLREVDGVADVGGGFLTLSITEALNIAASEIDQASYLIRYRLAADRVEIEHMGGARVRAAIPLTEIPA